MTITLRHDLESSSRSVEKRSSSNQISQVELTPSDSFAVTAGPVRVPSKRMVCWRIRGLKAGSHQLTFSVDGSDVTKELAIGDGLMRLGIERPDWNWSSVVLHPNEPPLAVSSPVKSIDVQYPYSSSWITGRNSWVAFWFIASTIAALSFSRLLGVNL
ncbi:MAG: hypothetical protein FJ267_04690 [Planctomycetes bacterium]|nr:hypothetical protein [Planctomycetota bacterium]